MKKYRDIIGDGGSHITEQVEARVHRLRDRMAPIRHKIAIVSGKGGVGKSSFTANLAQAMAESGWSVGALDSDINGPCLARMLGVESREPLQYSEAGVVPPTGLSGIRVMSMDLFVAPEKPVQWTGVQQETYLWRGANEANALREFLADTVWGELDYLLLDLPPGTDRFPTVHELLPDLDGVIILTIPSEASQFVVRKMVTQAKERNVPILGLIENMAGYVCGDCGNVGPLFSTKKPGAKLSEEYGIPFLGSVPFDPRLSEATDGGRPFLIAHPESPAVKEIRRIARQIVSSGENDVGTNSFVPPQKSTVEIVPTLEVPPTDEADPSTSLRSGTKSAIPSGGAQDDEASPPLPSRGEEKITKEADGKEKRA